MRMGSVCEITYDTNLIEFTGHVVYPKIIEKDGYKYIVIYWEGGEVVTIAKLGCIDD